MLAARVRHLVPDLDLADDQIPLSAEVICGGIAEACSDLDIDIRAKLVVLKLFERLLADKLEQFYQTCNQTLISEGVMPGMKNARSPCAGAQGQPASQSRPPRRSRPRQCPRLLLTMPAANWPVLPSTN